jgi:hypothetical protein
MRLLNATCNSALQLGGFYYYKVAAQNFAHRKASNARFFLSRLALEINQSTSHTPSTKNALFRF